MFHLSGLPLAGAAPGAAHVGLAAGAAHVGLGVGATIVFARGLLEGEAMGSPQQIFFPGIYKESIINLLEWKKKEKIT